MNKDLVKTLNLGCIPRLVFFKAESNWEGKEHFVKIPNPEKVLVEDLFIELSQEGSPFLPHFGIMGHLQSYPETDHDLFYLDPEGPHILFITGIYPRISLKVPPIIQDRYKTKDHFWFTYWEDTQQGYLFQINQNTNF